MFHVPGLTDHGIRTYQVSGTVDIFPTLAELAMGVTLDKCPKDSSAITTCTEGVSLVNLIHNPSEPVRKASYSVYSRGFPKAEEKENSIQGKHLKESQCLTGEGRQPGCVMGYTMLTSSLDGGHELRYTEWAKYPGPPKFSPDWSKNYGIELYNHTSDPGENVNVYLRYKGSDIIQQLQNLLHAQYE